MRVSVQGLLAALFGLLWLVGAMPAAAQEIPASWQALGGPGGRITHLTAAPDGAELYAATATVVHRRDNQTQWRDTGDIFRSDALYRSADAGATWQPLTNDLPPGAITALYADPVTGDLYVAIQGSGDALTRRQGLWRSSDRGDHWAPVDLGRADLNIWRIARGAGGRTLYLGGADAAGTAAVTSPSSLVLRSNDDGRTWTSFTALRYEQRPGSLLTDLIPHPTISNTLFITTLGGELYVSADAGETWRLPGNPENPPPPGWIGAAHLAISLDQADRLLLVRQPSGISPAPFVFERSTDGGITWTTISLRSTATGVDAGGAALSLAAAPGDVFLLSTGTATYRSADGGVAWQHLEGPLSSGGVAEFLVVPDGRGAGSVVLAATGYGLFASRDAGALWAPLGAGLPFNSGITGLLTDARLPERVLALGDHQAARGLVGPPLVLRSADAGRAWTPTGRDLPDVDLQAWAVAPDDPNTLYLAAAEQFFYSSDGGLSWRTAHLAFGMHNAIAVAASAADTIYVSGRPALRAADRGVTWAEMPVVLPGQERQVNEVTGLVVDPADSRHLWAALDGAGVAASADGGVTWQAAGLAGSRIRWLIGDAAGKDEGATRRLYAGVPEDGIYRWDGATWASASAGLPISSTILALIADPRTPGVLWAARDGGGVYRSTDYGDAWANMAADVGDNLAQALAIDYSVPGGLLMGTATAGVWALRPRALNAGATPAPASKISEPEPAAARDGLRTGVDARIEIVWPHDGAKVKEAKLANIGLRLFQPRSLVPTSCGWLPKVTIWQAMNNAPAEPLGNARQRTVDGQPFPFWELNDVDVSQANDPERKLYFMVRVAGTETATSVWSHAADPRTFFPNQDVPSGTETGLIEAVDARIQVVWPHDEAGAGKSVTDGTLANIAVAFFKHGTRLSVPVGWQPAGITLYGAWNQEVGRPLAHESLAQTRQAGAITYPIWEFNNIPVARAVNPENKLYLWAMVDGVETYPALWTHGADARTFFPVQDEPVQGCAP
ncbi:MAG: hypothetical protein NT169_03395 [Chloroflexi bacterium]|nr:hypothetical protein [Chloroflexota bacterium]